MPFTPTIPVGGIAGWNFLTATLDRQNEIFAKSPDIQRDLDYFEDNIQSGMSLDDFVSDRRLLRVGLSAFGLSEEVDKRAFVRKILEEGTTEPRAFAVRLNNPQYLSFARAFNFDDGTLRLTRSVSEITGNFRDEAFETELGTVDNSLRLALNFKREIKELASRDLTEDAGWFSVMGSLPLREVFEGAFNLPTEFSQIDIDRQAEEFADRAEKLFGSKSISALQDDELIEKVIRRYLVNEQVKSGPSSTTPGYTALALLGAGVGGGGLANLIASG